nr:MAG TPA: hypothetical protein [Bacteriophage sp.]
MKKPLQSTNISVCRCSPPPAGLWPTYQALNESINSRRKSDR